MNNACNDNKLEHLFIDYFRQNEVIKLQRWKKNLYCLSTTDSSCFRRSISCALIPTTCQHRITSEDLAKACGDMPSGRPASYAGQRVRLVCSGRQAARPISTRSARRNRLSRSHDVRDIRVILWRSLAPSDLVQLTSWT